MPGKRPRRMPHAWRSQGGAGLPIPPAAVADGMRNPGGGFADSPRRSRRSTSHGGPPPGPAPSLSAGGATLFRRDRSAVLAVRSPRRWTPRRLRRCAAGRWRSAPARPCERGKGISPRPPLCQKGQPTVFHFPRCASLSGNPSLSLLAQYDPHTRPGRRRSPGTGPASSLSAGGATFIRRPGRRSCFPVFTATDGATATPRAVAALALSRLCALSACEGNATALLSKQQK